LKLLATMIAIACFGAVVVAWAQDELTVDATQQLAPPARARGPFPGSSSPGHSSGLPIRLDLALPSGDLTAEGTALTDFRLTNIGSGVIALPIAIHQGSLLPKPPNTEYTVDWLTLWLTSDAIDEYVEITSLDGQVHRLKTESPTTSAELYGRSDDPQTFYALAPGKSIVVHASSRVRLKSGSHSLTAHAELVRESISVNGITPDTVSAWSQLLGTADSETRTKRLSTSENPAVR
jgi:hypothetical protein